MLKISRTINKINKLIGEKVCYLVIFMALSGVYEVISRYFFNKPTIWVWEINGLLLCVLVALTGGYALLNEAHVRVDIIYERLSERTKAIIDIIMSSLIFIYLISLFWQTVRMSVISIKFMERSQSLFAPPIYPFKIILAIGILFFLVQSISSLLTSIAVLFGRKEAN
jgi:TRAP-type mannitol/chloroaromatic compound transport system permease small subunit